MLVFEDLHWADPLLLEFLEHLADHTEGVPLLLVGTTRPQLSGTAPTWAASALNLVRVNLRPLGPAETARLIGNLLGSAVLPAEVQEAILDRAGGNPLYAEQFVRLLQDQHVLTKVGAGWRIDPGAPIPLPPGVHGLIAARLDMLPAERKGLLQDAAVMGKVFWSGTLAAMGGQDEDTVGAALHELARTELIRLARRSSMAGQAEYTFAHALIRDVCYGQIPRGGRARRHQRAAAWIEQAAGDRAADHAEILAAHYTTALQLARAVGDPYAGELAAHAVRYLMLAGDRALGIDVEAAERHYATALQLCDDNDLARADLLARHGGALRQRARYPQAARAYEQAIELFRGREDPRPLAAALHGYSLVLQALGDPRQPALSAEALALLEPLGPSPDLVQALAHEAGMRMGWGDDQHAIEQADRAIALAAQLGLPLQAWALGFRGSARADLGDAGGLDDLRTARDAATAQGSGYEAAAIRNNLAFDTWAYEGPHRYLELAREGADFARRRGIEEVALWLEWATIEALAHLGSLDEALSLAAELDPRLEQAGDKRNLIALRATRLRVLTIRGEHAAATGLLPWLAEHAERVRRPEDLADVYALLAAVRAANGDAPGARAMLAKLGQTPSAHVSLGYAVNLAEAVRTALAAAEPELAAQLTAALQPRRPLSQHALITARALVAEYHGHHAQAAALFADAASHWRQFHMPWEHAQALLGYGRCLLALGQTGHASQTLRTAREIFATLSARPALDDTDRLLAQATTASA